MTVRLIHYPKCSTCQKAKKWLEERGVTLTLEDITTQTPTQEELRRFVEQSGLPLRRFFNTSGLKYKALHLADRLPTLPEEEQLQLLASDGMLIKRPLVIHPDFILVGFNPTQWDIHFPA